MYEAIPFTLETVIGGKTNKIRLVPFQAEDQQRLIDNVDCPETLYLWAGKTFSYPLTHSQLDSYRAAGEGQNPEKILFTAVNTVDNSPFGHVEISDIAPALSARIARVFIVDKNQRGRGLGAALVKTTAEFAFLKLGVDRVDLGFNKENLAAERCYQKLGFKPVGFWENAIQIDDFTIDVQWMTLFRKELTSHQI
ncbi:MAG: hypothetical protein COB29_00880 [Sulfitobacter sp.]|nr:MAG: hypothetical protein COB29_00880 [Sulfitobacter sp.]